MHVCTCAGMRCLYVYRSMCLHVRMRAGVCVVEHVYIWYMQCVDEFLCVCVHVYAAVCVRVCVCVYIYIYIYTYFSVHVYLHVYLHVHLHVHI